MWVGSVLRKMADGANPAGFRLSRAPPFISPFRSPSPRVRGARSRPAELAHGRISRRVRPTGLTLPQAFSDYAAFFAGRLAGLEAMRVLSEPAAAANAYAVDEHLREEGNVVVLHVGGGTAEASVLTLVDGAYEALGLEYDPFFGGQDLDRRIVDHFVGLVRNKHGKDISNDGAAMDKLRTACERAKKTLSHQDDARVTVESLVDGVDLAEPLTRAEFEELNHDLFLKVVELVDKAVSQARDYYMDSKLVIDEVVLIGGSTMIPKVRELVRDLLWRDQGAQYKDQT